GRASGFPSRATFARPTPDLTPRPQPLLQRCHVPRPQPMLLRRPSGFADLNWRCVRYCRASCRRPIIPGNDCSGNAFHCVFNLLCVVGEVLNRPQRLVDSEDTGETAICHALVRVSKTCFSSEG